MCLNGTTNLATGFSSFLIYSPLRLLFFSVAGPPEGTALPQGPGRCSPGPSEPKNVGATSRAGVSAEPPASSGSFGPEPGPERRPLRCLARGGPPLVHSCPGAAVPVRPPDGVRGIASRRPRRAKELRQVRPGSPEGPIRVAVVEGDLDCQPDRALSVIPACRQDLGGRLSPLRPAAGSSEIRVPRREPDGSCACPAGATPSRLQGPAASRPRLLSPRGRGRRSYRSDRLRERAPPPRSRQDRGASSSGARQLQRGPAIMPSPKAASATATGRSNSGPSPGLKAAPLPRFPGRTAGSAGDPRPLELPKSKPAPSVSAPPDGGLPGFRREEALCQAPAGAAPGPQEPISLVAMSRDGVSTEPPVSSGSFGPKSRPEQRRLSCEVLRRDVRACTRRGVGLAVGRPIA